MTIIAAFLVDNVPVILGDMLISGPELTDRDVGIPTIGDVTEVFPSNSGYSIVGMEQKIVVLSDDLVQRGLAT